MQLLTSVDPRDNLEKAKRMELFRFARQNGIKEIEEAMPAMLMRKILRSRGMTNIRVPDRPLASTRPTSMEAMTTSQVNVIDAETDLERQYMAEKQASDFDAMPMNELRAECKRRGIKMSRTDNLQSLRDKLRG
jgi:hypothetical protein